MMNNAQLDNEKQTYRYQVCVGYIYFATLTDLKKNPFVMKLNIYLKGKSFYVVVFFSGGLTEGPAGRYGRTIIRITKTT